MPISPLSSITRAATRQLDEPLNILTFPTHERYESQLAKTGHNFYAYRAEGIKDWNTNYAPLPDNYSLLDPARKSGQIPLHLDFDLVLSQNKFGQFQIAIQIARQLHIPMISLEHTLPVPQWDQQRRQILRSMRGHTNVFISDYSIDQWGWDRRDDTYVLHHGLDVDRFNPNSFSIVGNKRYSHILSVVNDWINRDWCCGFSIWQRVTKDLPVHVVGDTPGLSVPAPSLEDLVLQYASSRIFLNTSTISPVPTALLEAMSCGCAVVSTATCMIPEVIENGVNGFISNDENELREYLKLLLNDEQLAVKLGAAARQTIVDRFSEDRFIKEWNDIFSLTANKPYLGDI